MTSKNLLERASQELQVSVSALSEDEDSSLSPKRKRNTPIDETKLSEDDARKLEIRRAYNRMCAAKARKRSKDLISQLQGQVKELTDDKLELLKTIEGLRHKIDFLERRSTRLMDPLRVARERQIRSLLHDMSPSRAELLLQDAQLRSLRMYPRLGF